jgi:glutaredoxin
MQKNGINIETRSIEDQEHMLYLVSNGGKRQVPCLFIDGKPLYESEDIIDYLAQCFGVG